MCQYCSSRFDAGTVLAIGGKDNAVARLLASDDAVTMSVSTPRARRASARWTAKIIFLSTPALAKCAIAASCSNLPRFSTIITARPRAGRGGIVGRDVLFIDWQAPAIAGSCADDLCACSYCRPRPPNWSDA